MSSLDFGALTIACFAKDNVGAARDESPRLSFIQVGKHVEPFTTIRELAPLFSPNRHGSCEVADNLSFDQVGIRLPSLLSYRYFKRKRIVEDSHIDSYKRQSRVQARFSSD